jgi:hypothetical protein
MVVALSNRRHPRLRSQGAPQEQRASRWSHRPVLAALPIFWAASSSPPQMPVYLRDAFGRLRTRFRFALLFSRAFFVGLCIDLFREFGQLFGSFCFFFEGLLQ